MNQESKSATTTEVATTDKRIITIVTTRGEKTKVNFEGNSWADLKKFLEKGGKDIEGKSFSSYSLSSMKCVESVNRGTLEHPTAVVPDGNFNLFLMPMKSKSGSMSRAEANVVIKGFIAENEERAKAHFNAGKNYTNKSTQELIDLVESYKPGTKKVVAKEKGQAIAQVVSNVAAAKADNNEDDILANLEGLSTDEKLDVIIQLLLSMKGKSAADAATASEPATTVATVKEEPKAPEETPEAKAERLEKERKAEEKRKEDEEIDKEINELMGGFNDVQRG